jgi:hypothetical protein
MSVLRRRRVFGYPLVGLVLTAVTAACATADDGADGDSAAVSAFPDGALINVSMESQVGVLLDDLQALPPAEAAKIQADIMAKPQDFWKERARMQLRLTIQRQYFRQYYHGKQGEDFATEKQLVANPEFGQLPLTPMVTPDGKDNWSKDITINGAPTVQTIDGHKFALVKYSYKGVLVTDKDSPGRSDKNLKNVGGSVQEDHQLPVDPDQIRQRTGIACLTESEFPPNSVDSENAWRFFEQSCTKDSTDCHTEDEIRTGQVREDCVAALQAHTGLQKASLKFQRVAYDRATADKYRVGTVTTDASGNAVNGPDMTVRKDDLAVNRLVWKYVSGTSCEIQESDMSDDHKSSCVVRPEQIQADGGGWRHVLEFNATGYNVGNQPIHIGNVNYFVEQSVKTQTEDHGIFEFSACHKHYHFKHYGDFLLGGTNSINKKNGFCLESTTRFSNNEVAPIFTEYGRCINQGVEIGWGDEYEAGLLCQWVDVTDSKPGKSTLGFFSNPDGFLCEGTFKGAAPLQADGKPGPDTQITQWEHTTFKTDKGGPVDKPACNFSRPDWQSNNKQQVDVTIPQTGGLVSAACRIDGEPTGNHYTFGPGRDCGLKNAGPAADSFQSCTPGQAVTLSCSTSAATSQVLRVCEGSQTVGGAIDCMNAGLNVTPNPWDSLASTVVTPAAPVTVSFTCPAARDKKETGGRYAVYGGAFVASDAPGAITCTAQ